MSNIIQQGAEAIITLSGEDIKKTRLSKSYRHPEIDKRIIKQRTKSEAKLLEKANKLINSPSPLVITPNEITMPNIKGFKLSEKLESLDYKTLSKQIGEQIGKLHDSDIIHGDLTTSNMILSNGKVFFIDFGLGFISNKIEDKAVDLHLIKQALEARHHNIWESCFQELIKAYKPKDKEQIIAQLVKVESRGRYKKGY